VGSSEGKTYKRRHYDDARAVLRTHDIGNRNRGRGWRRAIFEVCKGSYYYVYTDGTVWTATLLVWRVRVTSVAPQDTHPHAPTRIMLFNVILLWCVHSTVECQSERVVWTMMWNRIINVSAGRAGAKGLYV